MSSIDVSWDAQAYHLPFVALRSGFIGHDQFLLDQRLQAYYDGFPPLFDYVRGAFWYLSGRVEAINLLNLAALLALIVYLAARFALPWPWTTIGLFAIPAVQTAAASAYTDIAANAFLLIVLMSICEAWIDRSRIFRPSWWAVLFFSAFMAANSKLQITFLTFVLLASAVIPIGLALRDARWSAGRIALSALLALIGLLVIGNKLILNTIDFSNPVYPVAVQLGPLHLPGPVVDGDAFYPAYLAAVPRPIRWLLSAIEYRALELRPITYMNGMGDVLPVDAPSSRMGGFFGFLSVFSVIILVRAALWTKTRQARVLLVAFCLVTLLVAFMPGSYESRYYVFWMMFVVAAAMIVLAAADFAELRWVYHLVLLVSLFFVGNVTGYYFLKPQPWTTAQVVANTDQALADNVLAGDVICASAWAPGQIVLSPLFHPDLARERPYAVASGGCQDRKQLPRPKQ